MYRVTTLDGHIDVTEDHSLLNEKGDMIKPGKMDIHTRLLSTKYLDGDIVQGIEESEKKGAAKALKELKQLLELNF